MTHVPFWLHDSLADKPNLERLMNALYTSQRLLLVLAGDMHYFHASSVRGVLHVVCGTGGAFAHLTHHAKNSTDFPCDPGFQPVMWPSFEHSLTYFDLRLNTIARSWLSMFTVTQGAYAWARACLRRRLWGCR